MSLKAHTAWIGAFVLGALALAVTGVVIFGSGRFFTEKQTYVLYFDGSVKGLQEGAPVMFRGVTIGSVKEIRVYCNAEDLSFRVPVLIEVSPQRIAFADEEKGRESIFLPGGEKAIDLLVEQGLRARLELQSLVTGQLLVQLDFFPESEERYVGDERYKELPTLPSSLEELTRRVGELPLDELMDTGMRTLKGLDRLVNAPELVGSVKALEKALLEIRSLTANMDQRVASLGGRLEETVGGINTLVIDLNRRLDPLQNKTRETAEAAQKTLLRAEELLVQLRDTTSEDSSLHYEMVSALRELSQAARSVRFLAESVERRPEILLRGKSASGGN